MVDFIEKMRLRAKAEEDIYFAEENRKLIEALHEKQAREQEEPPGKTEGVAPGEDVLKSDR